MKTFSERLAICLKRGQMAQGDLRWWFGRSYSTTASWLNDKREPRGPSGDEARRRLALLEKGIALKKGFPIPVELSSTERPAYIEKLYHDHTAGVSRKDTAGRRLQMRNGVS